LAKTSGNLLARYPVVFFFLLAHLFSWPSVLIPFDNVILEILSVPGPTMATVIVVSAISGRSVTDDFFTRRSQPAQAGFVPFVAAVSNRLL
jgi:hypothetical protein